MKLKRILFTTILLATASAFASSPPANKGPYRVPSTSQASNATHANASQNNQEVENVEVPKKIDPKLQAKLDAKVDDVSEEQYQKIVAEYKEYLRHVPSEVRQEIRAYRQEIVQINRTKAALYKKLSQEAQRFLSKEREIKKKLPIKDKAAFAKELKNSNAE
jgi:hypothetical protein